MEVEEVNTMTGTYEVVRLDLKDVEQLFNSLDPSPFIEKDLDQDAIDYVVSSYSEHSLKTMMKIAIHMPKTSQKKFKEKEIVDAIHNYFKYEMNMESKRIRLEISEGKQSLVIGLLFLFACLSIREGISTLQGGFVLNLLEEALLISGWVSMWKPISNLLYDWWPMKKKQRIFEKISTTEIQFIYY